MKPLRAYLLMRRIAGNWDVTVHRDLESVVQTWNQREHPSTSAIVHVGFWRPETSAFEVFAAQNPGRVLVTASAKYSLSTEYRVANAPLGAVGNLPVFLALNGWGYEIETNDLPAHLPSGTDLPPMSALSVVDGGSDWLSKLNETPVAAEACIAGIVDESSYLLMEANLPRAGRIRLGLARYVALVGISPEPASIISNLRYTPPWFLASPISILGLSVRGDNCMRENGVETVSDLTSFGVTELLKFDKFGRKSLRELEEKLVSGLLAGPYLLSDIGRAAGELLAPATPVQSGHLDQDASSDNVPLVKSLRSTIAALPAREARVISARMGIESAPMTLQEIGADMGVTRERIRQIEQNTIRLVSRQAHWIREVEIRLDRLLSQRREPLPLLGLEILDAWFTGIERLEQPFDFILKYFCEHRFALVRASGQVYVSQLSQLAWDKAVRLACRMLEASACQTFSEDDAHSMCDSLLVGAGEEMRPTLWDEATRFANFVSDETGDGKRILVSYGAGAESVVEAVLASSARPMHYTEIARRCSQLGRSIEVRRAHSAAASVGLLFARGTFGLAKHYPLSVSETQVLIAEVEELVLDGDTSRQWHAREIFEAMEERGLTFDGKLTPYVVSMALAKSRFLVDLGRMVWTSASTGAKGTSNRIDVHQAIVSLLLTEGRPMRASEIKDKIERERGLNCFFQIQVEGPLVRLGAGLWGLVDRDIPLSDEDAEKYVDCLVAALQERGKGLHVTEIQPLLQALLPSLAGVVDPMVLIGLAQRDQRCATGKGQFVYLREWGSPRRLTVSESIRQALQTAGSEGLSLEGLCVAVQSLAERCVPRFQVSQACAHLGAIYDDVTLRWSMPDANAIESMGDVDYATA
ncbi:putative RNA polymerase sigma factor [Burkholderia cepacia]|uniref:DNA-directed RNA polymerase subunit alpha C-terminal domain-containing protein n=1 Tax=Burkholderia cepacia TaxID=292 RepID=UPI001CB4440D|nr:DNA-directed RNA polymerase subunit alpha C-terminal domain-containing protein [Burkholderia cepacia]CAG9272447.1 putative RNA polymerase sigma factor [Burkholderia cepacia]